MKKHYNNNMIESDSQPRNKLIIGRMTYVHLHKGKYGDVPAKVDTGADTSSIDSYRVWVDDEGKLNYVLFNKKSPYYRKKVHKTTNYSIKVVRSSNGKSQIRYAVRIGMVIEGKRIKSKFTLTDRSSNIFPVLIGAITLRNKFIVDTSYKLEAYKAQIKSSKDNLDRLGEKYSHESSLDPIKFYKERYLKQ